MSRIIIELHAAQLEQALSQLDMAEQLRLAKRLAARHMQDVVAKLRRTVRRKRLSARAIHLIVEHARREVLHRRRH